jgi:antitoxin YefM
LKKYCDQAVEGETLVISRKGNKNVVMISEDDYNRMAKAMRNAEYLAKLEHSFKQLETGHVVTKSVEELMEMEG